ncbi:GNAT family N-acetyltransferase [Roseibium album]|uniref:GNAT family N-acetyltransferase n=1 Tax=Roseibium album TaxID=311410 RepID=UPI00391AAC8A
MNSSRNYSIRPIDQQDFFWLKEYDCAPLNIERDSIYLFFCVHFSNYSFIAVDVHNNPIGFLLGFLPANQSTAYVHFLFVHEKARGNGIGKELMHHFIDAVRSVGGRQVTLYTIRAVSFYESLGFVDKTDRFSKEVADYITHAKGAVPMSLHLDGGA